MTTKDVTIVGSRYVTSMTTEVFSYTKEMAQIQCSGLTLDMAIIVTDQVSLKSKITGKFEKVTTYCHLAKNDVQFFDSIHDLLMYYCENEFNK